MAKYTFLDLENLDVDLLSDRDGTDVLFLFAPFRLCPTRACDFFLLFSVWRCVTEERAGTERPEGFCNVWFPFAYNGTIYPPQFFLGCYFLSFFVVDVVSLVCMHRCDDEPTPCRAWLSFRAQRRVSAVRCTGLAGDVD